MNTKPSPAHFHEEKKSKLFQELTDQELFQQYAEIEEKASLKKTQIRNELVKRNMPLVSFIIGKYYTRPEHKKLYEDLMQEGAVGLLPAIEGYDPNLGFKFSTYSSWWIRQAINNYLGNVEPLIKVPSHIRSAQNKLIKHFNEENLSVANLPEVLDEDKKAVVKPTFNEMIEDGCSDLQMTEKMTHSIKSAFKARKVLSMDGPSSKSDVHGEVKPSIKDQLLSPSDSQEAVVDNDLLISVIGKGLEKLTPKKRLVLFLRFNVFNNTEEKELFPNE